MSVTITKVGEGVFKVQRDNVYMDGQFNVTSINDNVNFYTKESNEFLRNILYSDISIVDDTQGGSVYNPTSAEDLMLKLKELGFFFDINGNNTNGSQILYMELNSSQDINVISPFTDLDFVEVTNTIPGATVSSNFPIGPQTYKGVVTLPAGKYKTSFKINAQNGTNTQKVVVCNISRYAPSVVFYPQSTVYEMYRNINFATLGNPDANYTFLELNQTESFGIITARTAAAGAVNTIADQSFWQIEKI